MKLSSILLFGISQSIDRIVNDDSGLALAGPNLSGILGELCQSGTRAGSYRTVKN